MPYRISRLGLVEIRSLDLDRDLDYYLNVLGLQLTAREGKTAYMKGWDERHAYSFALTDSDRPGMVRMAFRTVDPEDLDYYEKRLKEFGVAYDVVPEDYRRGRALRFTAPSGHTVELYNAMDYTGNVLPTVNPPPWPEGLRGIAPPRLDHTLVTAPEPQKAIEFFQTVLEFRVSEMLVAPDGTTIAAGCGSGPLRMTSPSSPGSRGAFIMPRSSWTPRTRCSGPPTSWRCTKPGSTTDQDATGSRAGRRSISSILPATVSRLSGGTRRIRWIRTPEPSNGPRTRSDPPSSTIPRS